MNVIHGADSSHIRLTFAAVFKWEGSRFPETRLAREIYEKLFTTAWLWKKKEGAKNKTKHKDDIKKQKSTTVDTHYVAWIKQDRVYMLCLLEITCIVFLFFHIFVRLIYPPSILPVASYCWAVVSVCPLGGTETNCAYYARIKHLFWLGITVKQLAKSWPCFNQVNLWVIPCPAPTKPWHYLH